MGALRLDLCERDRSRRLAKIAAFNVYELYKFPLNTPPYCIFNQSAFPHLPTRIPFLAPRPLVYILGINRNAP